MTDGPQRDLENRVDRYARGELRAEEARELARSALESPELFEELTASALAREVLARRVPDKVVRFPARMKAAALAACAAAAVTAVLFWPKPAGEGPQPESEAAKGRVAPSPPRRPALAAEENSGAEADQPLLLAKAFPAPRAGGAETFRGDGTAGRSPRREGSVVAAEDGSAALDLGALDGLSKGMKLPVFRDGGAAGQVEVITVFRERSRAKAAEGAAVRAGDRVRVPDEIHIGALADGAEALAGRGDREGARRMAEAAARAGSAKASASVRRALELLAALDYQAGSLEAAERRCRSLVEALSTGAANPEERASASNDLAVLGMLRGDYAGAERSLEQAVSPPAGKGIARGRGLNNLGALAELRGDRRKAAGLYAAALEALQGAKARERRAVELNLARVRGGP